MWAESYFVVPERLPPAFLDALMGNAQGIGGSLQQLRLESARELLWFGLATPPPWAEQTDGAPAGTLRRAYLIITGGQPALLISEDFALRDNGGVLSLADTGRATAPRSL